MLAEGFTTHTFVQKGIYNMIFESIKKLVTYGLESGLIEESDRVYTTNRLLEALDLEEYDEPAEEFSDVDLESTLKELLDYAVEKGLTENSIVYRDLFDTKLMGLLTPRPSEVDTKFWGLYNHQSAKVATDYFYKLSQDTDYIRRYRVKKDMRWIAPTEYGDLDITINLSKPEKDPKAIAAAKLAKQSGYPKCLLCYENVGYAGRVNSPARQNHRVISLKINGTDWGLQYSPYVYYNEHCILFNKKHTPMVIDRSAFEKLFDFVRQFPHYFIGSNADLPIVGGSILSHEHFQGGKHSFPMFKAPTALELVSPDAGVKASLPDWYNSVVLLQGKDKGAIVALAEKVLGKWLDYSDESVGIIAKTDAPHNTLAPIARKEGGEYFLYLLLRNNRCDEENPDGIFHAHKEYHNIKSESIGLIEAMGRFILPGRLDYQLKEVEKFLTGENKEIAENMTIHKDMISSLLKEYGDKLSEEQAHEAVFGRVEKVCESILDNTAVFKRDERGRAAFLRFLSECGFSAK